MGNKNSNSYQPEQIVNHLRQQYPQLNNEQLQQLYTRWYLRNNQGNGNDRETSLHLANIANIIKNFFFI